MNKEDFNFPKIYNPRRWNEIESLIRRLSDEYMAPSGKSKMLIGEILRAVNRIVYRYYNDGDIAGEGYGRETVAPACAELLDIFSYHSTDGSIPPISPNFQFLRNDFVESVIHLFDMESYSYYEIMIKEMCKKACELIEEGFDYLTTIPNKYNLTSYSIPSHVIGTPAIEKTKGYKVLAREGVNLACFDEEDFEESCLKKRSKKRSKKMKENNLVTKAFAVGPGRIRLSYRNAFENWDEYVFEVTPHFRDLIEKAAKSDNWYENLAEFFEGKGVESIMFDKVASIENKYYLVWKVTYDPKLTDIKKLEKYLEGQMSDGWGESFEQHSIDTYYDTVRTEIEYVDDEGNPYFEGEDVKTQIKTYYLPWSYSKDGEMKFRVYTSDYKNR